MSWQTRVHELIRQGRIYHPEAVKTFLDELKSMDLYRYAWPINLDTPVSSLPTACRAEAMSILLVARREDFQDTQIMEVIEAAAHQTRDVKPAPSTYPTYIEPSRQTPLSYDMDFHSQYYENFGGGPIAGNPF